MVCHKPHWSNLRGCSQHSLLKFTMTFQEPSLKGGTTKNTSHSLSHSGPTQPLLQLVLFCSCCTLGTTGERTLVTPTGIPKFMGMMVCCWVSAPRAFHCTRPLNYSAESAQAKSFLRKRRPSSTKLGAVLGARQLGADQLCLCTHYFSHVMSNTTPAYNAY